jgi:glycine/D-amino acid oxidase-like deaminating enzyme
VSTLSPWIADVEPLQPRAPLPGDRDVDVAILGAGYTGLWTAHALQQHSAGLRIGILDAAFAGFGASGRNGAWCVAGIGVTPAELARRYGPDVARSVTLTLRETVDEIGRVCAQDLPAAQFHKGGVLRVARGPHEWPSVVGALAQREALGLAEGCEVLDAHALAGRLRVRGALGAFFDASGATVHPGHLVRGLADLVEQRGAALWEDTRVTAVTPGHRQQRPVVHTDHGKVTADVVVLAGEAFLSQLPGLHRHLMPIYSLAVMTEPLTTPQLHAIGWESRECVSSHRLNVDYLSRTADGRILVGGRGAPYHYGSRINPSFDTHESTHERLRRSLQEWFPPLADVGFTHAWGGAVGMPRDWMPTFTYRRATGLAAAFGYTGQGVAASHLAGKVLADAINGDAQRWDWLPMTDHRPRRWEPEPLRWLAVRALQTALDRIDSRAAATGTPPTGKTLAERLTRH